MLQSKGHQVVFINIPNKGTYVVRVLRKDGWDEDDFYEDLLANGHYKANGKTRTECLFSGFDVIEKDNNETVALIMEYFESTCDLYDYINCKQFLD